MTELRTRDIQPGALRAGSPGVGVADGVRRPRAMGVGGTLRLLGVAGIGGSRLLASCNRRRSPWSRRHRPSRRASDVGRRRTYPWRVPVLRPER